MTAAEQPGPRAQSGIALRDLTTLRVGGPAARLVTAATADELVGAVREADDAGDPLLLLSGGSNLLISDDGFPGTVVRVATRGLQVEDASACGGVTVRVAAGEPWDAVVAEAVARGWAGIECLSGIPGLAGATPVQNVGAYGQDVAQTIAQVRAYDRQARQVRTFTAAECGFGYRTSAFKHTTLRGGGRFVVLDVTFQLRPGTLGEPVAYAALAEGLGVALGQRAPLAQVRAAVLEQRRRRGMVLDAADHDTWSCGSFFTNPQLGEGEFATLRQRAVARGAGEPPRYPGDEGSVKTSAAWLIDRAGFGKGFGLPGPAGLSTKHTLAVTNRGSATAADVLALARRVRDGVEEAFGVRLVNEPVLVGLTL